MNRDTKTLVIVVAVAAACVAGVALPTISEDHADLCDILDRPTEYKGREITTIGFVAIDIETTDAQAFYCQSKAKVGANKVVLHLSKLGTPKISPIESNGKTYWPALLLKGKVSVLPPLQQVMLSDGTAQYIGMVDVTKPLNEERDWAWRRAQKITRRP